MHNTTIEERPEAAAAASAAALPPYEPPRVITYRGEEILEELGPWQACTGFTAAILFCG